MSRLRDLVRSEPKPGIELPAWLERLTSVGIVTTDPKVARRQRFTNVVAYAVAANAASHFVVNSAYSWHDLGIVHAYNALYTIIPLLLHRLHRFGDNVAAITLFFVAMAGMLFIVSMLGLQSSLHVYFTLTGALLFMLGVENWRLFLALFALACAALLGVIQFAPQRGMLLVDDMRLRQMLSTHAMINTIVMNAVMIFYALAALRRAEGDLEQQYARSEALVATVMPPSIAARLKSGMEPRIADRIENLSVLFADLVGFTAAAHELPPGDVVDYLDHLVRTFDALCESHGVEKIKTIGDSYMAVAGLHGNDAAGAVAIGRLALAMMDTIARQPALGSRRLAMRIGIHCGEATAGVIGDSRISYDVWGDAVNMASRMESQGEPGRIQVSEAFRRLTDAAFVFEERGATPIKGLGAPQTFFLVGPRPGS